ncbi:hypothetical protein [Nocardia sp. NPDC051570]|uniref:hypothetical protein n=1 Tax=Nocardia sp. NPDC051570 TaxID=3364324 RepID=UPI0037AC289F
MTEASVALEWFRSGERDMVAVSGDYAATATSRPNGNPRGQFWVVSAGDTVLGRGYGSSFAAAELAAEAAITADLDVLAGRGSRTRCGVAMDRAGAAYARWIMALRSRTESWDHAEMFDHFEAKKTAVEHMCRVNGESVDAATDAELAELEMERTPWNPTDLTDFQRAWIDQYVAEYAVEYLVQEAIRSGAGGR